LKKGWIKTTERGSNHPRASLSELARPFRQRQDRGYR